MPAKKKSVAKKSSKKRTPRTKPAASVAPIAETPSCSVQSTEELMESHLELAQRCFDRVNALPETASSQILPEEVEPAKKTGFFNWLGRIFS
jgi:hypothetical protein